MRQNYQSILSEHDDDQVAKPFNRSRHQTATSTLFTGVVSGLVLGCFLFRNQVNESVERKYDNLEMQKIFVDRLPYEYYMDNLGDFIDHNNQNKLREISVENEDLLYLNEVNAVQLLNDPSTLNSHYFSYQIDVQKNQAYCAVATSAAILNSLRFSYSDLTLPLDQFFSPYTYATQHDVFNSCTNSTVIHISDDKDGILTAPFGLSLDQVVKLLGCNLNLNSQEPNSENWIIKGIHADPDSSSVSQMRKEMVHVLNNTDGRIAINYHRGALGQVGGGHFSPIGAYNSESDSFLILDVAKYKYRPVWVTAQRLYESLSTIDSCGSWKYPFAQELLVEEFHSFDINRYKEEQKIVGCVPQYRGYVVVKKA